MEKAWLRQQHSSEAIILALQGHWEEAVAINRSIIELFPDDVDAYNRLGKALTELGRYDEAEEAYRHVLNIDPNNAIARRNLRRLSHLKETKPVTKERQELGLSLFVKAIGKSTLAELHHPAPKEVLTRMAAGEQVYLKVKGKKLIVENRDAEYLGEVGLKLALRLIKLMEEGNRYQAAIASVSESGGRIIIKETFQHPSQAGRSSFPLPANGGFKPCIKDSIIKYELEDIEWDEAAEEEVPSLEEPIEL